MRALLPPARVDTEVPETSPVEASDPSEVSSRLLRVPLPDGQRSSTDAFWAGWGEGGIWGGGCEKTSSVAVVKSPC